MVFLCCGCSYPGVHLRCDEMSRVLVGGGGAGFVNPDLCVLWERVVVSEEYSRYLPILWLLG